MLGVIATFLAFRTHKYLIEETSKVLNLRAYGILLLFMGFSLHTLGDLLSPYYGDATELLLESIAHVIILGSFIVFYLVAQQTIKSSRRYWFK